MDYKEYSRLRSIARKRIERASAAGATDYIRIPTVAEVRASANPSEYMRAVKEFLSDPESSLAVAKKTGSPTTTKIVFTPLPPVAKKEQLTPEAKRARRNEQKRRSKAKRAVEKAAENDKQARKKVGYLKALETVTKEWKSAGVDVANWLGVLSPGKAKSFVNYMEYRFSQGDYINRYTIDTFIKDSGQLLQAGDNVENLKSDFDNFLAAEKKLKANKKNTNKYGIQIDEVSQSWRKFVKYHTGE